MTDQNKQSAHWLDKIKKGILAWQEKNGIEYLHVDDMKTPSGRVHTGALRGVLLHDLVAKNLGGDTKNTYVFNDMDPMDGLPSYLDEKKYTQHMGKPMFTIPRPSLENSGLNIDNLTEEERKELEATKNFGELYATDFIHAFKRLGCSQEIIWSHELYQSGKMDGAIRTALDNVDELKKIYKDVADYDLPSEWYPFQVICPKCGKVGTTLVSDWDGQEVTFECQENKVEWAKGCGYKGKISPFGGNGKLLWKTDWPAHWAVIGVNVEGAGKDHTSAGGSRDMADAICKNVFDIQVPFDIPYEWILIRGAKMSSSKGVGTSAREFINLFPAEVGRFLFASRHYNQVIDFDPSTMSIPDLFDEYDTGARIYWGQEEGDHRLARSFELSQLGAVPSASFLPRFRDVVVWMQHPELDLVEKLEEVKGGKLTESELAELKNRQHYAEVWLNSYAPEEFQLRARDEMPEAAKELTVEQRGFLVDLNKLITEKDWDPAELQQAIFDMSKDSIGPRPAFQAIYLAFLGKKAGPRAAWFVLSIDSELREKRIKELSNE